MGQKTNPISNRIGITRGWDSNWCGGNYAEKIAEDYEIRKYLGNRLAKAGLSRIVIERTLKLITVTIYAARPGFIIGKGGTEVDKLKEELKKVTSKEVQINIYEVKRPEVDARFVSDSIARQIEGRVSYRRAIKMAIANAMRVGAEGIKVQIAGRVGGAEMARSEMFKEGRTPLHTFRADIDYALAVAKSRSGSATVRSTASRILPPQLSQPLTHRPQASAAVDAESAVVAVATASAVAPAGSRNNFATCISNETRLPFRVTLFFIIFAALWISVPK